MGKVWCSSDCTGRGIMMKRMMIHIRSVRVRGSEGNLLLGPLSTESGDCFWLTGSTLRVSDCGGMFNGNRIGLKSLTGGDLDWNVRY